MTRPPDEPEPHPSEGLVEALRRSPLLQGLPAETLAWLAAQATETRVDAGELLLAQGDAAEAMYVVLEGTLDVAVRAGDATVPVAVCGPGDPVGELALVAGRSRSANVTAREPSRLLRIDGVAFERLLDDPGFLRKLVSSASMRLEERQLLTLQHTKLAALGELTAGLLHELNNPTAALSRQAAALRDRLDAWEVAVGRLEPPAAASLQRLAGSAPAGGSGDALERSDAEQRLQRWLADRQVAEAWRLAPALVAAGFEADRIGTVASDLDPGSFAAVLEALAARIEIGALLDGVGGAAQRIGEVVAAMRAYSHHGEAPVQEVLVHDGLDQALRLLEHKIPAAARIVRDYDPDLPRIEADPGDLNSVWTNLIDNALDAVGSSGTVTLRTSRAGGGVVVEVHDDGPGVAPEIQARVFDPFYTTKPIGKGTGVGLALAYTIVAQTHGGDLRLESEPGHTVFRAWLPRVRRSPERDVTRREARSG